MIINNLIDIFIKIFSTSKQVNNKSNNVESANIHASSENIDILLTEYAKDIYAFEYSAILDDKTCPTCAKLDGSVIAKDDPAYYKYKPPIHDGCRCMWVAIMNDEINKPQITGIKL
ncbi:MAG: minor capsid protein [Candidatus Shapirobacteria bacterium]|nr:minor capsid protein [Candidatus Shapirobacteria bacterium]